MINIIHDYRYSMFEYVIFLYTDTLDKYKLKKSICHL